MTRAPKLLAKALANLQPLKGQAKPYQIRQFLRHVERYHLKMRGDR